MIAIPKSLLLPTSETSLTSLSGSIPAGMYVRLAFAVAVSVEPQILVVDEALAVGDEMFQRKCFSRIRSLKARGCTILFVSHSGPTVIDLCDRAMLIDRGECILMGSPKQVVANYHKLINAPQDLQEELRASIHASGGTHTEHESAGTDALQVAASEEREANEAFFDRALVSKNNSALCLTRSDDFSIPG